MAEAKKAKAEAKKTAPEEAKKTESAQGKAFDRRHWSARIGLPMETLKESFFRDEYPFESHIFDLNGRNYHYIDEGEGEPVVMVHGNPSWSYLYRNLVCGLRGRYRCMVPDHLGLGLSEKPQNYRYNLENHIRNLETWLEGLLPPASWNGGRINLIVHDWGGPIGLSYAIRHPERIKRVVILNTSAFTEGDMPFSIKLCRYPLIGPFLVRGLNLFAGQAVEKCVVKPLSDKVKQGFLLPYNSWANRVGIDNFVKDIPLSRNTNTFRVLRKLDDNIADVLGNVPMLIQWGMKDWCFTPDFLAMWKKRFPKAEVNEYRSAGHYLLEDAVDEILGRIGIFLERPAP